MDKFGRFWVRVREFLRDNSVMLAVTVGALLLLVVCVSYLHGCIKLEELGAYAMFGTALATLLLGFATGSMVRETRASRKLTETQIEENRRLAEAPRIRELMIQAVNPLLASVQEIKGYHERREYAWVSPDLEVAKQLLAGDQDVAVFQRRDNDAFFPDPCITVEQHASTSQALNQALYGDLGRRHPSLIDRIQKYDKKAEDFRTRLADLAKAILPQESEEPGRWGEIWQRYSEDCGLVSESEMREMALSLTCFTFYKLLGASEKLSYEQVKNKQPRDFWSGHKDFIIEKIISRNVKDKAERIAKDADGLAEELKGIEEELSQIKDSYRDEYHLPGAY